MAITRRAFLTLTSGLVASRVVGQRSGVASRGVTPLPRPKLSGRPFDAYLVDIAKEAGLTEPVIYGGIDDKDYILEADGCGCAFLDYDNDGWLDIFLLNGHPTGRRTARDNEPAL